MYHQLAVRLRLSLKAHGGASGAEADQVLHYPGIQDFRGDTSAPLDDLLRGLHIRLQGPIAFLSRAAQVAVARAWNYIGDTCRLVFVEHHTAHGWRLRSEEHTSELQSPCNLV